MNNEIQKPKNKHLNFKTASNFYTNMTGKKLNYNDIDCDGILIKNKFKNTDKLYLNIPFVLKDEAKIFGIRWDNNIKKWYLPKTTSIKNIDSLLSLEKKLYGRNNTIGYLDYHYSVTIPKYIELIKYDDEEYEIIVYGDHIKTYSKEKAKKLFNDGDNGNNKNKNNDNNEFDF